MRSFPVHFAVMVILLSGRPATGEPGGSFPDTLSANSALTGLLSENVRGDEIDYKSVCADPRLKAYTGFLATHDPEGQGTPDGELAFWLNAYNAYTLDLLCGRYPLKSINQLHFGGLVTAAILKKTIWDRPIALINGKKYTLKALDHEIIRTRFKDPRLQFAMYCGSVSCPPLRGEAYDPARLTEQLDDQSRRFLNGKWNAFDLAGKSARLSPVLNWNAQYFGGTEKDVLQFIAQFLPPDVGRSLKEEPAAWAVTYESYDLTVNDAKSSP